MLPQSAWLNSIQCCQRDCNSLLQVLYVFICSSFAQITRELSRMPICVGTLLKLQPACCSTSMAPECARTPAVTRCLTTTSVTASTAPSTALSMTMPTLASAGCETLAFPMSLKKKTRLSSGNYLTAAVLPAQAHAVCSFLLCQLCTGNLTYCFFSCRLAELQISLVSHLQCAVLRFVQGSDVSLLLLCCWLLAAMTSL